MDELPDTLEKVTLGPNPALIDGDTSASASLDIGYAPALAGDSRPREAGIQLSAATEVNLLRAWTDRPLPPAVFAGYGWSVLRSDDNNLSWTPVPLISAVLGGGLELRGRAGRVDERSLSEGRHPSLAGERHLGCAPCGVFVTGLQAFLTAP